QRFRSGEPRRIDWATAGTLVRRISVSTRDCLDCRETPWGAIMPAMNSPAPTGITSHHHHAHRCSFHPDRRDLYLRLGTVSVFVRDPERSVRFYVDQLGFELALDMESPSGERLLAVAPPDGTAILALVSPRPASEEYKLIGRPTPIEFLTEDVF